MADEMSNTMNLDLNLGPITHSSGVNVPGSGLIPEDSMNLEEWLDGPVNRFREAVRHRRRWRSVWRHMPMPPEARNMALELIGGSGLEDGEGSIAAEEIPEDTTKVCENKNGFSNNDVLGKKDDDEKGSGDTGSFFDCNICLDLSKDPVVTCCGHLFCWPCLYRWLHIHSDAKECPVCKGEVITKNLTPIYGRGKKGGNLEDDSSLKIPLRPQAQRIESFRQALQRPSPLLSMDEMIRLLNGRFDLSQGPTPAPNVDAPRESPDRTSSLLSHFLAARGVRNRELNNTPAREQNNTPAQPGTTLLSQFLAARGLRREQNNAMAPDDVVNLPESSPTNSEVGESRRVSASVFLRRSNSSQAANISHLTSALSSAERLVESYFNDPLETLQEQAVPVDDRDSISSIAAVIHSESQTVDTAVEIDSTVSNSTSSSRRRQEASRVSDVDSGDSRAPRRRRLG